MQHCQVLVLVPILDMTKNNTSHQIPEPSKEDLNRIEALLGRIGGRDVSWGAQSLLEVWTIEQRAMLDQRMSERINKSSWALVTATIGLVVCTAGLIWATLTL
jgi:hypothetical protein